jgi:hypothetical protein
MLYCFSARFFFLQLVEACSYLPSVCGPAEPRGSSYSLGRNGVVERAADRWIHGRDGSRTSQLMPKFRSGREGSLVVMNITIGIEASLTTTLKMGTVWRLTG